VIAPPSPLWSFSVRHEQDVVTARRRAAQVAALAGFDASEQTRIATAVSEIVRNAFRYAGSATVDVSIEGQTAPQVLIITVADHGRGIANLDAVLAGRYRSTTGMGIGLAGARRLMDQFDIESSSSGTTVTLKKLLPRRAPFLGPSRLSELAHQIGAQRPGDLIEEIQRQNQELLRTLGELQRRQEELVRLNRELEDTNRGVVALYAELDEKADHLRRADELKSRFLSNMTHEFRTPVNSILALTDLLDQQLRDRDALPEVAYIRKSAEQLSELVNDLLDLAKVEAGKTTVRPTEFEVANLFGALRGMLRPLLVNRSVSLVFDEPSGLPTMQTDEGKVSQILRNFISNALKFTEGGEVRVAAALDAARAEIVFTVADTGIGIAAADQSRIFEEFVQIENPLQKGVKGTGLGLPLSKRLAELLGGRVWVKSAPGAGSTFSAAVPIFFEARRPAEELPAVWDTAPGRQPVLILEDAYSDQLFYEKILKDSRYHVYPARTLGAAREIMRRVRPAAIVLDVLLDGDDTWQFLTDVKADPDTRSIPVVVVTTLDDARKGLALGADVYATKPIQKEWLLTTLNTLVGPPAQTRVLVVDDQDAARYIVRQYLRDPEYAVVEARSGAEGLDRARDAHPDVILLDLSLGDMNGREVLRRLKSDPVTARPPVILVTSTRLQPSEREELALSAAGIVSKDRLSSEVIRESIRHARSAAGPDRG
jgi:signal transduction histidine kinase/CheY-like chemotaxis protein